MVAGRRVSLCHIRFVLVARCVVSVNSYCLNIQRSAGKFAVTIAPR